MSAVDPSGDTRIPALDGVRAVAVVLVILFHLQIPGFFGGFLGVDIFFVLSGFLITGLLLREVGVSGRISLARFWARRARRLLPALIFLLAIVALVGMRGTPGEREELRTDLVTTAGYVANWRFVDTSSYFEHTGLDSPLLHAWSLAVEEQFYLLWPLAFVAILAVASRRHRFWIGVLAALVAVVSGALLWFWWEPGAIERAYMGTDARIVKPVLGGLGAMAMVGRVRTWVRRRGPLLAGLGVVVLLAGVTTLDGVGPGYYAGGAIGVSLGALLLIAPLSVSSGGPFGRVLSSGGLVWLGTISYGLYLWHWPVAIYLHARDLPGIPAPVVNKLAAWALTVAVAAISYRWVERPFRHAHRELEGSRSLWRTSRGTLAAGATALASVSVLSIALTVTPEAGGARVVMLTGDSVPLRLRVSLEQHARDSGVVFLPVAFGACPVTGETPAWPDGVQIHFEPCPTQIPAIQDAIVDESDPDVIVWWDRWSVAGFFDRDGGVVVSGGEDFWEHRRRALSLAVTRLSSRGAVVVLVGVEPPGIAWESVCGSRPVECRWRRFLIQRYDDTIRTWNGILDRYAQEHPDRAVYLDLGGVVCERPDAPCDDRISGVPARPDGIHYEGAGADVVADLLWRRISEVMRLVP